MSLSQEDFKSLNAHWAVSSIKEENLKRADDLVNRRLAQKAVGNQIEFSFDPVEGDDDTLLERVVLAYEMAAVEGLEELINISGNDEQLRKQTVAASYKAFNIYRILPVPEETHQRMFFVFRLSALAYCGDRWSDLRRWYNENQEALKVPSAAKAPWDFRLLYRLFDCWIRLFRKDGWDDLDRVSEIVAGLRNDQKTYEESCLANDSENGTRSMALRLVAMYHWAKASETLAHYMLQGEPADIFSQVEKHFGAGIKAAAEAGDIQHEMILRWLHASGRTMVTNSLWWATRTVNSRTTDFVRSLTKRESHRSLFELLPPQRAALLEQGLLDQAKTAIVVELPTSGGKTLLAQFRILQALNQFDADGGWVAYVAPTRALSAQITRRLRRDFEPINIKVEQLTAAVEVDAFEERMLTDEKSFRVLVATPEKLSLVIRNKKIERPLALVVMDEAHNLEEESRGLRVELLLATVKRDCPTANFLLLMPYVEDIESIARWLAQDVNAGRAISLGTTAWKPNERIIGTYRAVEDKSERAGWHLEYETLATTKKVMPLRGNHFVGGVRPIPSVPRSKVIDAKGNQAGLTTQTAAMATVLSSRESDSATSVAVANRPDYAWNMARDAVKALPPYGTVPENVKLVQDFLKTEIDPDFELVSMLNHGVGVHHAGLSDEVRSLVEWLAESGNLRVLCATSTLSQGINFPVSSVFLASHMIRKNHNWVPMAPREFWNLAGRAGRIDHDTVGIVGIAEGTDREEVVEFVSRNTGELVSRLVTLIENLAEQGSLDDLSQVFWQDQWEDFRCYIAHLWAEKENLDAVLTDSENLLRQTYGYTCLQSTSRTEKAEALLKATKEYVRELANMPPSTAELADSTGFSPESVRQAMTNLNNLEEKLSYSDWMPDNLFGDGGKVAELFGVMLNIKQIRQPLEEIAGKGFDHKRISNIALDWVNGERLGDIAKEYFTQSGDPLDTNDLTKACKAIYRAIVGNGTWGLSALRQVSGIDFDKLSETDRFKINVLPAMVYHGVRSEDAVLMRMNSAPRSAAEALGTLYRDVFNGDAEARYSVRRAREFLKELDADGWSGVSPKYAQLSGRDYKRIWEILSGENA